MRSFFWSVFSRIRPEYRDLLVNLCIQSEYGKIRTRKTHSYLDTFHAVGSTKKVQNEKKKTTHINSKKSTPLHKNTQKR